mmetsp:Transcript_6060/g.23546  ORF Transcript_6060/g.23546 Transcript_6060/m.23546 type:complete len:103 (-) Transcript_6060:39-347(-)
MLKVIDACPFRDFQDTTSAHCVFHSALEDQYFGSVLAGLSAPLPSPTDAAHFALEQTSAARELKIDLTDFKPVGLHKVWKYAEPEELEAFRRNCKYYERVAP